MSCIGSAPLAKRSRYQQSLPFRPWKSHSQAVKPPVLFLCLALLTCRASAQSSWTEKETRLANEYLSLLVEQPEYGRVLDMLWDLYARHDATALLLKNIQAQAAQTEHLSVRLIQAHLLRKAGDLTAAAALYDAVLKQDAAQPIALRARAEIAQKLNDMPLAMILLRKAAEATTDASAYMQLGNLALSANQSAEAVKAWERAAELRPADLALAQEVAQLMLQAGYPEKSAALLTAVAEKAEPASRLQALLDLARVRQHADQFTQADAALVQGLALLHFRESRYAEFFLRRVRLHERFGALEDLAKKLRAAATKQPVTEQALADMARFSVLTVDPDEQLKWLRELVKVAPQQDQYRWELVRVLLDHEGAAEAATLLDARLKNDASDLATLVLLRANADLRMGQREPALKRIRALMDQRRGNEEVQRELLSFATEHALDDVAEDIMRQRMEQSPGKTELVYELANFYRAHERLPDAEKLLLTPQTWPCAWQMQQPSLPPLAKCSLHANCRAQPLRKLGLVMR
jgi:predicted Zn-dependent protease